MLIQPFSFVQGGSESSGSSNAGGSSSGRSAAVPAISTSQSNVPSAHSFSFTSGPGTGTKLEGDSDALSAATDASGGRASNIKSDRNAGNSSSGSVITLQTTIRPFRLAIMKAISNQIADCEDALSVIPLLQVLLVILAELDGSCDDEVEIVETLVKRLMDMMNLSVSKLNL